MMYLILILIIIGCLAGIYFQHRYYQPKLKVIQSRNTAIAQENIQLESKSKELQQEVSKIEHDNSKAIIERDNLKQQIENLKDSIQQVEEQAQQAADSFLKMQMALAEKDLAQAKAQQDKELQDYILLLDTQKISKENELAKLDEYINKCKSTTAAIVEEKQRQQKMESEQDFYRIVLTESEKNEIKALMSIEHLLSNKRNLYMLIWSSYYSKRVNEMAVRVLGDKPVCGIYRITNIETEQMYVGQAKDIRERVREHCKMGLKIDCPNPNKLYTNMQKYGIENFAFELLEKCEPAQLNEREKYWIDFYKTYDFGLNSTRGNK